MKLRVVIWLIVILSSVLQANDGGYQYQMDSGTMVPVVNDSIRMVEEEVIYHGGYLTTDFLFRNETSETQQCTFGFPVIGQISKAGWDTFGGRPPSIEDFTEEELLEKIEDYYNFHCEVNGEEIQRRLVRIEDERVENYDFAFVFDYSFEPHEEIRIFNRHDISPGWDYNSICLDTFDMEYILVTGSFWSGTIEKARIVFNIPLQDYMADSAAGYPNTPILDSRNAGEFRNFFVETNVPVIETVRNGMNLQLIWQFHDFEPSFNIVCKWGVNECDYVTVAFPGDLSDLLKYELNETTIEEQCRIRMAANSSRYTRRTLEQLITAEQNSHANNVERFHQFFSDYEDSRIYLEMLKNYILGESRRSTLYDNDVQRLLYCCRFYINTQYAFKGHRFRNDAWNRLYSSFDWYQRANGNLDFTEEEQLGIDQISEIRSWLMERIE